MRACTCPCGTPLQCQSHPPAVEVSISISNARRHREQEEEGEEGEEGEEEENRYQGRNLAAAIAGHKNVLGLEVP